jgi:hypothetical protein
MPSISNRPGDSVFQPFRNPISFTASYELKLDHSKLPPYQKIQSWIPFPINSASQNDVQLISAQPANAFLFPPKTDQEIGLIYSELNNHDNSGPILKLTFSFKTYEISPKIEPTQVGTYSTESSLYQRYTQSEPHLETSEEMQKLASLIIGEEKNPYLKAQKIYRWMLDNIKFCYPSYPLVLSSSASHYAFDKKAGDSTLQAFLFTTLCRSAEIPARVVGGYQLIPGHESPWAWSEFYLPNYGWIPVDSAMAQTICLSTQLKIDQKKQVQDYYFGHLDAYRLTINQTAPVPLYPIKNTERNMDLLLFYPEIEAGNKNIPNEAINFSFTFQRL